jgi:hypothetical protein
MGAGIPVNFGASRSSGPTCRAQSKVATLSRQNCRDCLNQFKARAFDSNFPYSFPDKSRVSGLSKQSAVTMKLFGRILLAFSAVLLAIGASMHTAAFGKVSAAVATSDLAGFFGKGLKVLWLQDSTVTMVLAIVFAIVAIRPLAASNTVIVLLGLVPSVTAALVYLFIGNFIGGHIFLTAGLAAILGGLLWPEATKP